MATIPASHHILLDLTCPHCNKTNLLAVIPAPGAATYVERTLECAHCKKTWQPCVPGEIMAGPFPK
jgi:phage FluMu protein Com